MPLLRCAQWRTNRYARTGAYCYGYIVFGFFIGVLGPTLPGIADVLHVQPDSLNFFFFFRGIGFIVGSIVSGSLFERIPGHWILSGSYAVMLLGTLVFPLCVSVSQYVAAVVLALAATSGAAVDVGQNTLLGWMWGDALGPYMQFMHFNFGIGASVMPLLVARVIELTGGFRWSYWIVCVAMLPAAIVLPLLETPAKPPEPHLADERSDTIEAGSDGGGGSSSSGSSSSSSKPAAELSSVVVAPSDAATDATRPPLPVSRLARLRALLCGPTRHARSVPLGLLATITALLGVYVGTESTAAGWLASYATETGLASDVQAAYLTAVFWGALTAGRLAGALLALRLHPLLMLLLDAAGVALSALLLGVLARAPAALWLLVGTLGFSAGSVFATAFSFPSWLGLVVGARDSMWIMCGVSLGDMTLPLLVGWLFQGLGYGAWPWSLMVLGVLMGALLLLLRRLAPHRLRTGGEGMVALIGDRTAGRDGVE